MPFPVSWRTATTGTVALLLAAVMVTRTAHVTEMKHTALQRKRDFIARTSEPMKKIGDFENLQREAASIRMRLHDLDRRIGAGRTVLEVMHTLSRLRPEGGRIRRVDLEGEGGVRITGLLDEPMQRDVLAVLKEFEEALQKAHPALALRRDHLTRPPDYPGYLQFTLLLTGATP